MKKSIFLSVVLAASVSLLAQEKKMVEFVEATHNFGTVKEGDGDNGKITTVFKFTNLGATPIFIESASASCGCTTPKVDSSKPIAPGEVGEVPVTYNTNGRVGTFSKQITVVFRNAQEEKSTEKLFIKGEVTAKNDAQQINAVPEKTEPRVEPAQVQAHDHKDAKGEKKHSKSEKK
ncbi:MAG: DUF1573 domain-containing protein [Prevotellaceae bacterium]|jgi:hypothetical protein|nr:DUF1573 domain-containing protein [Prevotellaceae bacterium]